MNYGPDSDVLPTLSTAVALPRPLFSPLAISIELGGCLVWH
jgi:hypothetical protein